MSKSKLFASLFLKSQGISFTHTSASYCKFLELSRTTNAQSNLYSIKIFVFSWASECTNFLEKTALIFGLFEIVSFI